MPEIVLKGIGEVTCAVMLKHVHSERYKISFNHICSRKLILLWFYCSVKLWFYDVVIKENLDV